MSSISTHDVTKMLSYRRKSHATLCILYQLKYCPTVVRLTQTDCVSAWVALSTITVPRFIPLSA